ncbi:MAG: rane protein [Marmoricola sp.]|nr:rane protein [Marmoricola sp.]
MDQLRPRFGYGALLWVARRMKVHTPQLQRVPRWITWFALSVAFGFLGWVIYLSIGITSIVTTHHYDIAWLGFDGLELSMVGVVAVAAWKHHPSTTIFTGICAVMFAVDAWFDVWTSPRGSVVSAAVLAVCLELPLVAVFTFATIHGERVKNKAMVVA